LGFDDPPSSIDHSGCSPRDAQIISRDLTDSRGAVRKRLYRGFRGIGRQNRQSRVRLQSGEELFVPYLPQPPDRTLQIRIGAEDIMVATNKPEGISAGNVLPGTIRTIELLDGQAILTILVGEEFYVRLTASAVRRLDLRQDSRVFLIMKTHSFRIL
jgi:molybdopterin-binding protein